MASTFLDADLLNSFVSEASDLLDEIDPALIAYQQQVADPARRSETINRVFRHFHSLKGSAGFLGFAAIAELTHEAETFLDHFRKAGTIDIPHTQIDLLCRVVDRLRHYIAHLPSRPSEQVADAETPQLIADLRRAGQANRRGGEGEPALSPPAPTKVGTSSAPIKKAGTNSAPIKKAGTSSAPTKKAGTSSAPTKASTSSVPTPVAAQSAPRGAMAAIAPPSPPATGSVPLPVPSTAALSTPPPTATVPAAPAPAGRASPGAAAKPDAGDDADPPAAPGVSGRRRRTLVTAEFKGRYVTEAQELLDQCETALLQANQGSGPAGESVAEALRVLHSFKGNSGFMGLNDIERMAHRMEEEIEYASHADNHISRDAVNATFDTLLQFLDVLRQGVAEFGHDGTGAVPQVDEYIALLDAARAEGRGAGPRDPDKPDADPRPTDTTAMPVAPVAVVPTAAAASAPARSGDTDRVSPPSDASAPWPRPERIDLNRESTVPISPPPPARRPGTPHMKSAADRLAYAQVTQSADLPKSTAPLAAGATVPATPVNEFAPAKAFSATLVGPGIPNLPMPPTTAMPPSRTRSAPMAASAVRPPAVVGELSTIPMEPGATAGPVRPGVAAPGVPETAVAPLLPASPPARPKPPAAGGGGASAAGKDSAGKTAYSAATALARNDIRVDLAKLDAILDLVGELVIAEAMVNSHPVVANAENESLERAVHQLRRVASELQDISMSVRMIPLATTFRRMIRLVFDLSTRAGKQINLDIEGDDTEVDKTVIEHIADPLVHVLRNAVDHGIETPLERRAAGKPEAGRIVIEGRHEGGEVWVLVTDDGRGLSREKILRKAIEKGLVQGDGGDLSDNQVYQLIFEPGLSTASQVTDVSGRGVGMDVVKKNIEKLNGRIDVRTRPGEGTAVVLRIPLTLAIIDGMLVRSNEQRYIIPLLSIRESLRPTTEMIIITPDGQEHVRVRDELIPVVRLHEVFHRRAGASLLEDGILMVVDAGDGNMVALFADELLGQQETVIKGMSGWMKHARGVSGATIFGDGEVGLILNVNEIVQRLRRGGVHEAGGGREPA